MATPSLPPERFALVVEAIGEKLPRAAAKEAQAWAGASVFEKVTLRSPVDTGRFRANFNVSLGTADLTVTEDTIDVAAGSPITAEERQELEQVLADLSAEDLLQVLWIANGLPYAVVIEFGLYPGDGPKTTAAGYSTQAPTGVVRVSAAEVVTEFSRSPVLRARLETVSEEVMREIIDGAS